MWGLAAGAQPGRGGGGGLTLPPPHTHTASVRFLTACWLAPSQRASPVMGEEAGGGRLTSEDTQRWEERHGHFGKTRSATVCSEVLVSPPVLNA